MCKWLLFVRCGLMHIRIASLIAGLLAFRSVTRRMRYSKYIKQGLQLSGRETRVSHLSARLAIIDSVCVLVPVLHGLLSTAAYGYVLEWAGSKVYAVRIAGTSSNA